METIQYFFSYARKDSEFVLKLAQELRSAGVNLWLDQLDILGGQRWDRAVELALQKCQGMILILSPDAVSSDNVMDEVSYAFEQEKLVVPILYRSCDIPFRLRRVQNINFIANYDEGFARLLRALQIEVPPLNTKQTIESQIEVPPLNTKQTIESQSSTSGFGIAAVVLSVALIVVGGWVYRDKWPAYMPPEKFSQATAFITQNNNNQTNTQPLTVTVSAISTLVTITPVQPTAIAIAAVRTPATNTTNSSTTPILAETPVTQTATDTQLATVTQSAILYTATPGSSATSTLLPTSTSTSTETPGPPTSTSAPTSTSIPTPTLTQIPPSGEQNSSVASPTLMGAVKLDQPANGAILADITTFKWSPDIGYPIVSEILRPHSGSDLDFVFELIYVPDLTDPNKGFALADASDQMSADMNTNDEKWKKAPYYFKEGKTYYWTVRLGRKVLGHYESFGWLAQPRRFIFKPSGAASSNQGSSPPVHD